MVLQLRREEPASEIPACAPEAAQPLLLLTGSPASFQAHHIQTVSAIREFFFFFFFWCFWVVWEFFQEFSFYML